MVFNWTTPTVRYKIPSKEFKVTLNPLLKLLYVGFSLVMTKSILLLYGKLKKRKYRGTVTVTLIT